MPKENLNTFNDDDDSLVALKVKVAKLETDISWIKDKVKSIDNKLWALIIAIVASSIGLIINILLKFIA